MKVKYCRCIVASLKATITALVTGSNQLNLHIKENFFTREIASPKPKELQKFFELPNTMHLLQVNYIQQIIR